MQLKWSDFKSKKKLIFVFIVSIFIQITIFLLIQVSDWVSQKPVNDPWFVFLTQTIEPYSDYKIWYQTFTKQTLYENWLPYINILRINVPEVEWYRFWFIENEELYLNFIYPPFFFYILILPSLINVELVFLPLLLTNVLLPIIIYKFLNKSFNHRVAEWGFIATAVNPLYLFYSGGLALNSSLITFFFILTLYFISTNRFGLSIVFLSTTILFKQIMILLAPPIIIYIVLKSISDKSEASFINYLKKFFHYSSTLLLLLFLGSLPWIIIAPENYISSLLTFGLQKPTFLPSFHFPYPYYNFPIFWFDFLYSFNTPYLVFWFFGFLNFTYIGVIALEIVVIYMLIYWYNQSILNWVKFIDIIIYTTFLSYLFFPRGLYKYYFSFYVPLIILWTGSHFTNKLRSETKKRTNWILIIVLISIIFMLLPRTYYLILIWGLFFYILKKNRILTKKLFDENTSLVLKE
ncbi:MAG: glycosyltransferase family 39 protein [Candidatus Thorarchaeota archaeon]